MKRELEGQIAIITGSDSGIGRATAVEFARHGASVVVHYNSDAAGAAETKRQAEAEGARAIVVQADVSQEAAVDRLFDACRDELGTPTILVNNAGVGGGGERVSETSLESWNRTLAVNLTGPFLCCRRFLRDRESRGPARIVNVTSVHEDLPGHGAGAYSASKGGLRNLTRCLSLELAEAGITVNNLAPGMVLTPMNQEAMNDPAKSTEQAKGIPARRAGDPEEVAKLALYLASPSSAYCTGTSFFIDGGLIQGRAV